LASGAESRGKTRGGGRERLALVLLCLTQLVIVLDSSIVTVALPSMGRDLGFSAGALQ
jgi:hypothetical protein